MNNLIIRNAHIVAPDHIVTGDLMITDGVIEAVREIAEDDLPHALHYPVIDAAGSYLLPGLIDLHTDAIDHEINPRPGADFPVEVAFRELERKMAGCGITTVYHSLHLGYDRAKVSAGSKYKRSEIFGRLESLIGSGTAIHHRLHLRYEVTGVYAYDYALELLNRSFISLLSVMDHRPGQGQQSRALFLQKCMAAGMSHEAAETEFILLSSPPLITPEQLQVLTGMARQRGIPVASHDDDSPEKVAIMYEQGIRISEFPVNFATAGKAVGLGMHTVGGAANIVRGGSMSGNMNVAEGVRQKLISCLCSDYYPAAILHAIFRLHTDHHLPLPEAVKLATLHPARAAGIDTHTGSIEPGKNADLILVNWQQGYVPEVTHTIVDGRLRFHTPNSVTQKNAAYA